MPGDSTPEIDLPMKIRQALYHQGAVLEMVSQYMRPRQIPDESRRRILTTCGEMTFALLELAQFDKAEPVTGPEAPVAPTGVAPLPAVEPLATLVNEIAEVGTHADNQDPGSPDQAPQG